LASGRAVNLGKMQEAREFSAQALQIYKTNSYKESAAGVAAYLALDEAAVGNVAAAHQQGAASEAFSRTLTNLPTLAVALALEGDSSGASNLIADLKRRYPSDFQVNGVFAPSVEALLQSRLGDTAAAIQALQPAVRFELAPVYGFFPVYVRGLVYLRGGQGKEAAAEFQKILGQRFLGATTPSYALAYVGLARAYTLTGDTAKARAAYQDFFALWKDADPDVPILLQAKAEYAKLK
jgi:eukaryotic-like serine/threonine-protein kinase